MTKHIDIDEVDGLEGPIYVLTAGGMAVGKSYIIDKHIKTIKVMDVDDVMMRLQHSDDYSAANFSEAMSLIRRDIERALERKESIVAVGTSSDTGFAIDKLYGAKEAGYKTVLLYVDVTAEQALKQNEERRNKGERAVQKDEEYKITRTNTAAATTVATLKNTKLVDYYVHVVNYRPVFD